MADEKKKLELYEVDQGNGVVATLKLTEEDAERIGAKRSSSTTPSKARTAPNKAAAQPQPGGTAP